MSPQALAPRSGHRAARIVAATLIVAVVAMAARAALAGDSTTRTSYVKRVRARVVTDSTARLEIDLRLASTARSPRDVRDARARFELTYSGKHCRSDWVALPVQSEQWTCVIPLGETEAPARIEIAVVDSRGRVLACTRWRRPASAGDAPRDRFAPVAVIPAAGAASSTPDAPPLPATIPTMRLTWGELKVLYRDPALQPTASSPVVRGPSTLTTP
jgi:hypothetical protein